MTTISRPAKFSRVDGVKAVDFHLNCNRCKQQNRVRLATSLELIERETCAHFLDYDVAQIQQGAVYFRFSA